MAQKKCSKCGEMKSPAHYIATKSCFFEGSLPICRECLGHMIEEVPIENQWNFVDKVCQWMDIPFIPDEWEKLHIANKEKTIGVYAAIFRDKQYESLDWDSYNSAYLELLEENSVEDAIPELKEKELRRLKQKWGLEYDEQQLEYLENLHQGLLNSQNIVGALNEDQALKLCKISLIIEERIRAGLDFSRELKSYDSLAQLANLTSKNVKDANEFDSAGEICAYLEKTGWMNQYYDGAIRDEVDQTEKNLKNWTRYLYVNETGIAEEIEQRIDNLRVAAELEGETFDEADLRDYLEKEDHDIKEEFKVEI